MNISHHMIDKAINWRSPHVRRIAEFIGPVISGLKKLGIEIYQCSARQIGFEYKGNRYRAGYDHPHKNPRQWGCISIWRIEGQSKVLVRRFEVLEDACVFCLHPKLD